MQNIFECFMECVLLWQGNYAVSGGVKGVEGVEAKAKSFKARMTVLLSLILSAV